MLGRLVGLIVVVPLMLLCAFSRFPVLAHTLAGVACVFFAYETHCIMTRPPKTLFGRSEQPFRFAALSVVCPLLVWCAHRVSVGGGGDDTDARMLLVITAACFAAYESAWM